MVIAHRLTAVCLLILMALAAPAGARPSRCLAMANAIPQVTYIDFQLAAAAQGEVKLTFAGHSTFIIESPEGITIATDYAGFAGVGARLPKVVTMNHAHETHYTDIPDPRIAHVLRGWNPDGGAARHDLEVGDVQIRNVPTDIRDWGGASIAFGNSIFIFELAGLCIGHLGHLHHTPTPQHYGMIGLLDVVMVPVDGTHTLNHESMVGVLKTLRARMILPMHFFSANTLAGFLARAGSTFPVKTHATKSITISAETLPKKPTIIVLPGSHNFYDED
jgi:L-ascorbate metabolism protein UlaG (beta-lactamase superfamily)